MISDFEFLVLVFCMFSMFVLGILVGRLKLKDTIFFALEELGENK